MRQLNNNRKTSLTVLNGKTYIKYYATVRDNIKKLYRRTPLIHLTHISHNRVV